MILNFSLKAIGKKRAYVNLHPIVVDITSKTTVNELLQAVVNQQVESFNQRNESKNLHTFLSEEVVKEKAGSGSVRFGDRPNLTKASNKEAFETVSLAYRDGLIALFHNDKRLDSMEETLELQESDSISIIRLTFLSGSIW